MRKSIAMIAVAALVAGQATVAFAVTKGEARVVKASVSSCAVAAKSSKHARVENRCQAPVAAGAATGGGIGGVTTTGLVFAGVAVAGAATVAGVTTSNGSSTSP